MHSPWVMVDSLMRELGSLRNDARALDPHLLDDRIVADVERHIAEAAQAIDETITGPEDEARLMSVCEAIVVARDRIDALRGTLKQSAAIVERSVKLRRQAARQLFDALRTRGEA
jgi:hypothetical protein